MTEPLLDVVPADPEQMARLSAGLAARAERAGLLDLAYATLDSSVGPLLLVASERGLLRVAYDRENHDAVLAGLAQRVSPRILRAPGRLDEPRRQLDDYLAGRRATIEVPVDLALSRGFRLQVQQHLRTIAYGRTESYATVARAVQHPRAVRAVGTACATNPLPLVIPCHRVLRSDGSLGGYIGGLEVKARLLALESAPGE